jgi:hypothetical protein
MEAVKACQGQTNDLAYCSNEPIPIPLFFAKFTDLGFGSGVFFPTLGVPESLASMADPDP